MTADFSIAIDKDQDGKYETEIRDQVIEMRWRLGMRRAYDSMAEQSWARITVDNRNGEFSPERHALAIGARIRIQSRHKGITRTHFSGALSHIEPEAGAWSQKLARLHLQDLQAELENSPALLPPQANASADTVIAALLARAVLRRPVLAGYCLVDISGYNLIDSARVYPPQRPAQRLEAGKTRFAYVGDWWRETTSARQAISDVVSSERGRFFINREGEAVFLNRHHTILRGAIAARFDNSMSGLRYSYGDQRLNCVRLRMRPRALSADNGLLWQLRSPLLIKARADFHVTLRLLDERDEPLGLLSVDRLASRFQLSANTTGEPYTREVKAEIAGLGASSATARISNRRRHAVYLTQLRLYGQALQRGDPLEIVVADEAAIALYGLKPLSIDLPALSDFATAQAFASYELARRSRPRGQVSAIRIDARQHAAGLSASLFDRIRISDSQTGHAQEDYFIIGEEHELGDGGASHQVSWTLEPIDRTRFVVINGSRVDAAAEVIAPY